jgi:hypothetical protein
MQALSDRWYLAAGLQPYLASDLRELGAGALFVEGQVEAGWACTESLAFRLGIATHARFGYYLPFPILGFAYQPEGSWYRLEALLPKRVRAVAHATRRIDVDLFGELMPQVWEINRDGLGDRFKYLRVKAGAGVEVQLFGKVHLRIAGGVIPLRVLDSYGAADPGDQEYELRGDLVPFFDASIRLGPRR